MGDLTAPPTLTSGIINTQAVISSCQPIKTEDVAQTPAGQSPDWGTGLHRAGLLVAGSSAISALAGFLFWWLVARSMPPEQMGLATAVVSAVTLVALLGKLGLDVSLLRHLPAADGSRRLRLIIGTLIVSGTVAALVAVAAILTVKLWAPALRDYFTSSAHALLFVGLSALWTTGLVADAILIASRQNMALVAKAMGQAFLRILLLFPLVFLGPAGVVLAALGSAVMAVPALVYAWKRIILQAPAAASQTPVNYSDSMITNYLVSLVTMAPVTVAPLILIDRAGPAEVAYFYVLWMIGSLTLLIPAALGQVGLVERASRKISHLTPSPKSIVFTAIGGFAVAGVGAVALKLFGHHYSQHGFWPLLPFGVAAIPGLWYHVWIAEFRASDRHRALLLFVAVPIFSFLLLLGILASAALAGWIWLSTMAVTVLVTGASERTRDRKRQPSQGQSASSENQGTSP